MLEILQRNLQVCQVSQECLWQVFVWNVFCRLEHLYSVCICISCKLVSSESKEGMSQAFGQINLGTHSVLTLPCLLAPVLPSWLVVTANSNLSIKWRCLSMGWGQQDGPGNRKVVLEKICLYYMTCSWNLQWYILLPCSDSGFVCVCIICDLGFPS